MKFGDGGSDVRPIVHLYKTQIYQLARFLGVPEVIQQRPPTSDTYSAPTTQEEFFFRLPFATMDLLWYAQEHGVPVEEVAAALELQPVQATARLRRLHPQASHHRVPAPAAAGCRRTAASRLKLAATPDAQACAAG